MNILTARRPEDEEDPLAPIKAPEVPPPLAPAGRILSDDTASTGGGSAPPPPAGVAILQQQLPEKTVHKNWHGEEKTTKGIVADPLALAAMGEADEARKKQQAANEARKEALVNEARAAEQSAQDEVDARNQAAGERVDQLKLRDTAVNAAMANTEAKRAEMAKAAKITSYWEDQSWPAKIVAALLVGAGQYASSGRGMNGRNGAWEIFQQAEAADRQKKISDFQNSKEIHEAARQGEGAVNDLWKTKIQEWDNQTEIKMKAIGAKGTVLAKKAGTQKAIADADIFNAKADEESANNSMKARQRYEGEFTKKDPTVSGGTTTNSSSTSPAGGKPPTEAQGRAEGFMVTALNEFGKVAGGSVSEKGATAVVEDDAREAMLESAPLGIGKAGKAAAQTVGAYKTVEQKLSDSDRAANRAANNFAEVLLRDSTGANAPDAEVKREAARISRRPGDTPKDIADKRDYAVARLRGIAQKTSNPEKYLGMIEKTLERAGLGKQAEKKKLSSGKTAVRVGNTWQVED